MVKTSANINENLRRANHLARDREIFYFEVFLWKNYLAGTHCETPLASPSFACRPHIVQSLISRVTLVEDEQRAGIVDVLLRLFRCAIGKASEHLCTVHSR